MEDHAHLQPQLDTGRKTRVKSLRINARSFVENGGWQQFGWQEFRYALSGRRELETMYY